MSGADDKLTAAKAEVERKNAELLIQQEAAEEKKRQREFKFKKGQMELIELRTQLFSRLAQIPRWTKPGSSFSSGAAAIDFAGPEAQSKFSSIATWDISAWSLLKLSCASSRYERSTTIFYGGKPEDEATLWEVSFYRTLGGHPNEPFALDTNHNDFIYALGPAMHVISPAFGPTKVETDEERSAFFDRWISRFADAMTGNLRRPPSMPTDD
jgi:hypothetical protein